MGNTCEVLHGVVFEIKVTVWKKIYYEFLQFLHGTIVKRFISFKVDTAFFFPQVIYLKNQQDKHIFELGRKERYQPKQAVDVLLRKAPHVKMCDRQP